MIMPCHNKSNLLDIRQEVFSRVLTEYTTISRQPEGNWGHGPCGVITVLLPQASHFVGFH